MTNPGDPFEGWDCTGCSCPGDTDQCDPCSWTPGSGEVSVQVTPGIFYGQLRYAVWYSSPEDIHAFHISFTGGNIINAYGGDAGYGGAGWSISQSATAIGSSGYDMLGNQMPAVPAGCGILVWIEGDPGTIDVATFYDTSGGFGGSSYSTNIETCVAP